MRTHKERTNACIFQKNLPQSLKLTFPYNGGMETLSKQKFKLLFRSQSKPVTLGLLASRMT